jgi:hypothetical protein
MKKLLAIFCLLSLVSCDSRPSPEQIKKSKDVTALCVKKVKAMRLGTGDFDAYYNEEIGQFSYFGTKTERFQFEKCLSENGVKMKPNEEK